MPILCHVKLIVTEKSFQVFSGRLYVRARSNGVRNSSAVNMRKAILRNHFKQTFVGEECATTSLPCNCFFASFNCFKKKKKYIYIYIYIYICNNNNKLYSHTTALQSDLQLIIKE